LARHRLTLHALIALIRVLSKIRSELVFWLIWRGGKMKRIVKLTVLSAMAGLTLGSASSAQAAGAIAIGQCDRNGWTYNFGTAEEAREAAVAYCASNGDTSCRVIYAIEGNCAAFAVDGTCGARGWALSTDRGSAEQSAIDACKSYGGEHCTIRRWVCDGS
jgi:hypothetical protein